MYTETVKCACGCDETFERERWAPGQPRLYVDANHRKKHYRARKKAEKKEDPEVADASRDGSPRSPAALVDAVIDDLVDDGFEDPRVPPWRRSRDDGGILDAYADLEEPDPDPVEVVEVEVEHPQYGQDNQDMFLQAKANQASQRYLAEQMDKLVKEMARLSDRFEGLDDRMDDLVAAVPDRQAIVELVQRVGDLETTVEEVREGFVQVTESLQRALESQMALEAKGLALQSRVTRLEEHDPGLDLASYEGQVKKMRADQDRIDLQLAMTMTAVKAWGERIEGISDGVEEALLETAGVPRTTGARDLIRSMLDYLGPTDTARFLGDIDHRTVYSWYDRGRIPGWIDEITWEG